MIATGALKEAPAEEPPPPSQPSAHPGVPGVPEKRLGGEHTVVVDVVGVGVGEAGMVEGVTPALFGQESHLMYRRSATYAFRP